jgi:predicted dehydrogenase
MFAVRGEFGYWVFEGDWGQPAQRPSWNYRKAEGGGIILDMLCHWRYVLDNLFGKVQAVSCLGATHIQKRVVQDRLRPQRPHDFVEVTSYISSRNGHGESGREDFGGRWVHIRPIQYFDSGRSGLRMDGGAAAFEIAASGAKLRLDPWSGAVYTATLMPEDKFAAMAANLGRLPIAFAQFQNDKEGKPTTLRLTFSDGQAYDFRRE